MKRRLPIAHPSFWGSVMGGVLGVGLVGLAMYLFLATDSSATLNTALACIGAAQLSTAVFTFQARRVAWAFSLSLNGTAAVVFLFASPRIRDAADVSIALAILPAVLFGVVVLLHSLEPEAF